jgi:hypothetical protein
MHNKSHHSIWILQVYREAERCLNTLSVRLGDEDFFFGSHPTSLDATVYAYLAPLLKVPFPSPALQNHLKSTSNLVKFVVRITQRYFPYSIQGMYYQKWNLTVNIILMRRMERLWTSLLTKKLVILTRHSTSVALLFSISNAVITKHWIFLWVQVGKQKYLFKSLCVES